MKFAPEPRRLFQRIMLSIGVLVTLVALAYGSALFYSMTFTETHLIESFMRDDITCIKDDLSAGIRPTIPAGTALYGAAPLEPIPEEMLSAPEGYSEFTGHADYFLYRDTWHGKPVIMVRDQRGFEETERAFQFIILVSIVLVSAGALLIGWLLAQRIMHPVKALTHELRLASLSPVYRPLNVDLSEDEIGELARLCDTSLKRLHEALDREKRFTDDVTHEFHTPLTVIGTSLELLDMTPLTPEQRRHTEKIERSCRRMEELLRLFLSLARSNQQGLTGEPAPLAQILQQQADFWKPFAEENGLDLVCRTDSVCKGLYNPVLLGTVVSNLLKNAVCYTQEGTVTLTETADGFTVSDTGPGIPPDEQSAVFETGYTGRQNAAAGQGLGLSIVRRLCQRMGWRVTLASDARGSTFSVKLLTGDTGSRADMTHYG